MLACGVGAHAATVSLLNNSNPGFDTSVGYPAGPGTNSVPGWQCYWSSPTGASPNKNEGWPSTPAQAGAYGFGVTVSSGTFWLETDPVTRPPVQPGTVCTFSFWMHYQPSGGGVVAGMRWYDSAGRYLGQSTNGFTYTAASGWQGFSFGASSPANADSVAAYFTFTRGYTEVDGFSITMADNSNGGAGGGLAPVVRAGHAQTVFRGDGARLAGSGFDYYYRPLTYAWSTVSGPGAVAYVPGNSPTASATFSAAGSHVLRLGVTAGAASASNDVAITVLDSTPNLLLTNPGFDASPGAYLDSSSGPTTDSSMAGWDVTFTYTSVSNSIYTAGGGNPPTYAGPLALFASALQPDPGQPSPTNTTSLETSPTRRAAVVAGRRYQFSFAESNPGSNVLAEVRWYNGAGALVRQDVMTPRVTQYYGSWQAFAFATNAPAGALWAAACFAMGQGYTGVDAFSLWGYRDGTNVPPVVSAGASQTIGLDTVTQLAGVAADADGDPIAVSWSQVSGPGMALFSDTNALTPWVAFSTNVTGTYVLRLRVTDGPGGHVVTSDVPITVRLFTGEKILIFAGQSNMEGHGTPNTASNLTAGQKAEIPNVYGFYSNASDTDGNIPSGPDPGGTPDPYGLYVYVNFPGYNQLTWATATTTNGARYEGGHWLPGYGQSKAGAALRGVPYAGGSWHPYAYWRQRYTGWTRVGPVDFNKSASFWYIGLNPGETWANATSFSSGEPVQEYGPEFMVAHVVHAANPTGIYNIVKYAPGGTDLADDWNPDNPSGCYNGMKQWVAEALKQKPGAEIAGFFWLQGESDAISSGAADYYANLTNLIARVRADFGVPNLPVVIAKISPGNPPDSRQNPADYPNFPNQVLWTNSNYGIYYTGSTNGISLVRDAQGAAAANDPQRVRTIDTADLPLLSHEWVTARTLNHALTKAPAVAGVRLNVITNQYYAPLHFDDAGIRTIGERMGQAWLALTTNTAINVAPVISAGADQVRIVTDVAHLAGSATDGDGDALVSAWSKLSGAGAVTFGNSNALASTVVFSLPGTYVLRLTVDDGHGNMPADDLQIIVLPAAPAIAAAATAPGGAFGMALPGPSGMVCDVYACTNLGFSIWNWIGLATQVPPGEGTYLYTDTNAVLWPRRFYRLELR